jgi:hypothetical protein
VTDFLFKFTRTMALVHFLPRSVGDEDNFRLNTHLALAGAAH